MAAECMRCWWCKCNNSCNCTAEQILWFLDNRKRRSAMKEPPKSPIILDDYKWLSKEDAARKYLKDTGKSVISREELFLLWF